MQPIDIKIKTVFDRHKLAVESYDSYNKAFSNIAKTKGQKERLLSARGTLGIVVDNEEIRAIESSKMLNIAKTIKQGYKGLSPFTPSQQGNIRLNDNTYLKKLRDSKRADNLTNDLYGTEIQTVDSLFSEYAGKDVFIDDELRRRIKPILENMSNEQKAYLGLLCRENMYLFYEDNNDLLEDGDNGLKYDGTLKVSKIMELVYKAKNSEVERIVL